LHFPKTPADAVRAVVREINEYRPDVLAIAGDMGESLADTEACLALFRTVRCPVLVLAGNHDLFANGESSQRLWEERLPEAVRRLGYHWLEGRAFVKHGVAVLGTIAWYDYSAADPTIQASAQTFAREKRYFTHDHRIDWKWTDIEFADRISRRFLGELDRLEADPSVSQIVVVTHVPVLECQIPRKPANRDWGFANAFFGNLTLGKEVLGRRKVSGVISGHTHVGREEQVRLPDGRRIDVRVVGSKYGDPKWVGVALGSHEPCS
jgi:3',5'-cyclic AMP phosphodiesterase CpdA